jgi:CRP/FNR family transcriptional regulator
MDILEEDSITGIQNNCTIINFKKGETIVKQGTNVTHALYVAKGMVKLYIEGSKNIILKIISNGNYIDLQTLYTDKRYNYSVSALENSMICMVNSDYFIKTAESKPGFLVEVTKSISNSLRDVYDKISDLESKQIRGRLADSLIYFAENIYKSNTFDFILTRKELAEFSNMTMENAVRILSEFKKDGIIDTNGREINILQPELLKRISENS